MIQYTILCFVGLCVSASLRIVGHTLLKHGGWLEIHQRLFLRICLASCHDRSLLHNFLFSFIYLSIWCVRLNAAQTKWVDRAWAKFFGSCFLLLFCFLLFFAYFWQVVMKGLSCTSLLLLLYFLSSRVTQGSWGFFCRSFFDGSSMHIYKVVSCMQLKLSGWVNCQFRTYFFGTY